MTTPRTPILRTTQCELPPMFWFLSGHEVQWRAYSTQFKRKRVAVKAPHECESLDDIRHEIDIIDHEIIEHIGRRFDYVKEVMRFKTTEADVRAPARYHAVLNQRRLWAQEAGLPPDVIEEIYRQLIDYFIDHEMDVLTQVGETRA